jgi:hypothetical protein
MVAAQIHDADDRPEPRQHVGYRNDNGALLGLTHYLFHRSTIAIEPVCTCRIYSRRKLRAAECDSRNIYREKAAGARADRRFLDWKGVTSRA